MRRFSIQLWILCVAALLSAGFAAPASAVTVQELGQNAPGEGPIGGCICTAAQFADGGSADYLIPGNGVLTKIRVWIGKKTEAGQTVQARTFHTTGPTTATVASEGAAHSITGLSTGQHLFYDRIPAAAGDVLGASFHDSALIEDTPLRFPTASGGDVVGEASSPLNPSLGQSFTATPIPSWRVNMVAIYESDEDHDGYGDGSQDLCLGSAIGVGACSGVLLGSTLTGDNADTAGCAFSCLRVQTVVNGASTAAPFDGVVVRWRLLGAATGTYRIRTVAPTGGGNYTVLHSSEPQTVTTEPRLTERISSFPTRLPISAGGYVGLAPPASPSASQAVGIGGSSTFVNLNDHIVDGATDTEVNQQSSELFYDADIEPDADHDGYGDVTQDSCPSTASIHEGACPAPPPSPSKATRPAITGFKAVPKSFRVKPGGAVVSLSRAVPKGTKLKLTLSEAATVAFTVEAKVVCKPAKTVRRCKPGFRKVHAFSRHLSRGAGSVPYSGRYKRAGKTQSLKPGAYRVTAVASGAGGSGAPAQTSFTVVP